MFDVGGGPASFYMLSASEGRIIRGTWVSRATKIEQLFDPRFDVYSCILYVARGEFYAPRSHVPSSGIAGPGQLLYVRWGRASQFLHIVGRLQ